MVRVFQNNTVSIGRASVCHRHRHWLCSVARASNETGTKIYKPRSPFYKPLLGNCDVSRKTGCQCMMEAVMIWNEPNNKSHWDPELDPGWKRYAETAIAACRAIRAERAS